MLFWFYVIININWAHKKSCFVEILYCEISVPSQIIEVGRQVGITRNSAASLCRGSPRLCNEYLLFRFPNLS